MDARNPSSRSVSRSSKTRPVSAPNTGGTNTPQQRPVLKASSVETSRVFAPNASIVLVGIRGCGKTSLGYIAARALGRRLVEADDEFERKTGCTRAQFLKNNGQNADGYRLQERQVMESMLANNERDAVIVCGVGSIESHGQALLRKYALSHPVIHIVRETEFVREWLRIPKESNLMQRLEESDRNHRICSNFEFYNLFDGGSAHARSSRLASRDEVAGPGQRSPRYAGTLQRTQEDFIRFVNLVMGFRNAPLQQLGAKVSAAAASPVDRIYTYSLTVEFSQILSGGIDIAELECGADAVELEIKASDIVGEYLTVDSPWITKLGEQFAILRRKIAAPIIFHVNKNSFLQISKESQSSQDEAYFELLNLGLRMGAEFVTVDTDFSEHLTGLVFGAKGSTAIIGDHMDINPSEQGWHDPSKLQRYERAARYGCNIVRLTQFASSDEDNLAIRRFVQRSSSQRGAPPLIAYNLGRLGRVSMCYNTILTNVTHPSLRNAKNAKSDETLLTLQEASRLTYDIGLLDPLKFWLFGGNILYSLSPTMHNSAYEASGLPHHYQIHQSSDIEDIDTLLKDPSFGGCSISLPYKIEVLKRVNSMSPEAQAIGAANTIIPIRSSRSDGSRVLESRAGRTVGWHGENTDWLGITTCIRQNLSPANLIRPWTSSLVIGAGGMARAAIYALIRLDVPNIFIFNRTIANAEKVAAHFAEIAANFRKSSRSPNVRNVRHRFMVIKSIDDPWPAEFEQPTIIVSCIPAHQIGDVPAPNLNLPVPWLQSVNGGVIVEIAYKPRVTPLLEQVHRLRETGRPWIPVNGLQVLPEQGIAQFELMTGRTAPRHVIRELHYAEIIESKNNET